MVFRHYRLRQKGRGGFAGEKYQWVSTNSVALSFGYGRHSYPGRFLATMEIKILFAYLLVGWDFAIPEGKRAQTITHSDFVRVLLLRISHPGYVHELTRSTCNRECRIRMERSCCGNELLFKVLRPDSVSLACIRLRLGRPIYRRKYSRH